MRLVAEAAIRGSCDAWTSGRLTDATVGQDSTAAGET